MQQKSAKTELVTLHAKGDGACLFNSIALGLAVEILAGRLDSEQFESVRKSLVLNFAEFHKNFQPHDWSTFKNWVVNYNNILDAQTVLAPVLFLMYTKHFTEQDQNALREKLIRELTSICTFQGQTILRNESINWLEINSQFSDSVNKNVSICPTLDNFDYPDRAQIINKIREFLKPSHHCDDIEIMKAFLMTHGKQLIDEVIAMAPTAPKYSTGNSVAEISEITDVLQIEVIENDVSGTQSWPIKIRVVNGGGWHWDVKLAKEDAALLDTQNPKLVHISSSELYNKAKEVSAPPIPTDDSQDQSTQETDTASADDSSSTQETPTETSQTTESTPTTSQQTSPKEKPSTANNPTRHYNFIHEYNSLINIISNYKKHLNKVFFGKSAVINKLGILENFEQKLNQAKTDETKKDVIKSFLENKKNIDSLTEHVDGFADKFIRACKFVLSVLTAGIAAIPLALHAKKYYGTGFFLSRQATRGTHFVNRSKTFADSIGIELREPIR